ncbi:MAG: FG-GAP repeat protein, partial [Alphaproteobacteria bacterium]|nr:FG-GAP repeat protein [Alphaproteobacteria bacterium]
MRPIFSAALLIACADPELSGSADLDSLERAGLPAPPVAPAAAWSALGTVDASFGESVALAGDVNGDGYDDVLVGAPGHSNGELEEGGAFLYLGSPTGLQLVPAWTAESNQAGARFGASVASAGDVNGDGYDDVVIGAPAYSGTLARQGLATLYLGGAAGLSPTATWSTEGQWASSSLGTSVASAGDVNSDGYDDVIVGAPGVEGSTPTGVIILGTGQVRLFLGSASGLSAAPDWQDDEFFSLFGTTVACAGDVNGDGFDDVAVSDVSFSGFIEVFHGGPSGLTTVSWVYGLNPDQSEAHFGSALASAGDVNGDGYDDLIVGGEGTRHDKGRVQLFLGSPTGFGQSEDWAQEATQNAARYGSSVAPAGDVNGDGFDDVLIGARTFDRGQVDEGAVLLYLGSPGGLAQVAVWGAEGDQRDAFLGTATAAGDVDGDGQVDVLVGAPGFDVGGVDHGGVFSFVVTNAPDTDGDGLYDMVDRCVDAADPSNLDTDHDGLGNACDSPSLEVVGTVSRGLPATLVAAGVAPGESVRFHAGVGLPAPGPCPALLGGLCLDVGPQSVQIGSAVADDQGVATLIAMVPAAVQVGGTYTVQAAIPRGPGG